MTYNVFGGTLNPTLLLLYGNSPTKNHEDRPTGSGSPPNVCVKCKGVGKSCNFDQYLALGRKRLKIDAFDKY